MVLSDADKIALDQAFGRLLKQAGLVNGLAFRLSSVLSGSAKLVTLGTPILAAEIAEVVDWQDGFARTILTDSWTNRVVKAKQQFRNDINITFIGDSASTITIDETEQTVTVHYVTDASTNAQIVAFVNAHSTLVTMVESSSSSGSQTHHSPDDDLIGIPLISAFPISDATQINTLFNINTNLPVPASIDVPRTVTVQFTQFWSGGTVTVTGLDAQGNPATEVFDAANGVSDGNGGFITAGKVAFSNVFQAVKQLVRPFNVLHTNSVAILSTDIALGLPSGMADAVVMEYASGTLETPVAIDVDNATITPSTTPDGSIVFTVLYNSK